MAGRKRKSARGKRGSKKNSLVANINRRKRAGKSRPKSRSSVSSKSYRDMQRGWPSRKSPKKKRAGKRAK